MATLSPNPFTDSSYTLTDKEKEELTSSAKSIVSDTTTLADTTAFHPHITLLIDARGIGIIRLPAPSSELEIAITHPDGSLAYTSTREKRSSGNAVLSHPKLGDLISTSYFFGPNRDPIVRLLQSAGIDPDANTIKVTSKWTSRSTAFVVPRTGKSFEWSYARSKDDNGKKVNLLVLRCKDAASSAGQRGGRIIAQLIRSEEARTTGSKSCSAGNGGRLVLGADAGEDLDEAVVVATCLLMLKKEIDRRRAVQMMVIAAAVSN